MAMEKLILYSLCLVTSIGMLINRLYINDLHTHLLKMILINTPRIIFFRFSFKWHQNCKVYMATSSRTGVGKPQVPLYALFQARAST